MSLSGGVAGFAYAYSLAAVEAIIQNGGMSDISRLLDRLSTSPSTEAALQESLRIDYAELDQQTMAYLRKEYVR